MANTTKRVLPADVHDALEFSALVFGGIGAGTCFVYNDDEHIPDPFCYIGHVAAVGIDLGVFNYVAFGISTLDNDRAVMAINKRKNAAYDGTRVTFREWCAELNVERAA